MAESCRRLSVGRRLWDAAVRVVAASQLSPRSQWQLGKVPRTLHHAVRGRVRGHDRHATAAVSLQVQYRAVSPGRVHIFDFQSALYLDQGHSRAFKSHSENEMLKAEPAPGRGGRQFSHALLEIT